jgi:hypothetical protein
VVHVGHVDQEPIPVEGALREVHEVRRVLVAAFGEGGGGGQPSGVAADGLVDGELVDLLHVTSQPAGLLHGQGREPRGAGVSRRVVGGIEIIVHRLGHAETAKLVPLTGGEAGHPMDGVHGVVAADNEDRVDVVPLELVQDPREVGFLQLVARRAQDRRGRMAKPLDGLDRLCGQIHELAGHESFDTPAHAEYPVDVSHLAASLDDAGQAGVDDAGGAAGLSDYGVALPHGVLLSIGAGVVSLDIHLPTRTVSR